MKGFVLLTVLVFSSKNENDVESVLTNLGEKIMKNTVENPILVKIEEDEYVKTTKRSKYSGVYYNQQIKQWIARRWSKAEKKSFYNGNYKYEETAAHASDTLARKLMNNGEKGHKLNFPDDNTEFYPEEKKVKRSNYIGVSFNEKARTWGAERRSKLEHKMCTNGTYRDEEQAAHASDTLARKLMDNGEKNFKLNFPDDNTEVNVKPKTATSGYFGVSYHETYKRWVAAKWNKTKQKTVFNGYYKDEETAAHASDTLARELMANGDQDHRLNFPEDSTEVYPKEKTTYSKFFGVSYIEKKKRWTAQRYSRKEKKVVSNGTYRDEEKAAHASDNLARKLIANDEQGHKLNFSEDSDEDHPQYQTNKRKRSSDSGYSRTDEGNFEKFEEKEK